MIAAGRGHTPGSLFLRRQRRKAIRRTAQLE